MSLLSTMQISCAWYLQILQMLNGNYPINYLQRGDIKRSLAIAYHKSKGNLMDFCIFWKFQYTLIFEILFTHNFKMVFWDWLLLIILEGLVQFWNSCMCFVHFRFWNLLVNILIVFPNKLLVKLNFNILF